MELRHCLLATLITTLTLRRTQAEPMIRPTDISHLRLGQSPLHANIVPHSITRSPIYKRILRGPVDPFSIYSDVMRNRYHLDQLSNYVYKPVDHWLWKDPPPFTFNRFENSIEKSPHVDTNSDMHVAEARSDHIAIPSSASQLQALLDAADVSGETQSDDGKPNPALASNSIVPRNALNPHRGRPASTRSHFPLQRSQTPRARPEVTGPRVPRGPGTFHEFVNTPLSPTDGSNCTFDPIEGAELRAAASVGSHAHSIEASSVRPGREACPPCECKCTAHIKEPDTH